MSVSQLPVQQVAAYLVALLVPAGASLIGVMIFTRTVPLADYGRYSVTMAAAGTIAALLAGWAEQAALRLHAEFEARGSQDILWSTLITALVALLGALTFGASVAAAGLEAWRWWRESEYSEFVPSGAWLVVARVLYQVIKVRLQAEGRASLYRSLEVVISVGTLLVAIAAVLYLRLGMWARVAAEALVVSAVLVVWLTRALASGRVRAALDAAVLRRSLAYGLPMIGWLAGLQTLNVGDRFVLQAMAGEEAVALYSAVYTLVERTASFAFVPLLMTAHPLLMKEWAEGGPARATHLLNQWLVRFLTLAVPAVAVGSVLRDGLVALVLSGPYRAGASMVPWLVLAFALWQVAMYVHKGLEFVEHTKVMLLAIVVAAVSNLGLDVLLIPAFGVDGAAMATLGSFIAYLALVWRPARAVAPFRVPARWWIRWTLAGSAAAVAARVGADLAAGALGTLLGAIAGLTAYGLLLWASGGVSVRWRPAVSVGLVMDDPR